MKSKRAQRGATIAEAAVTVVALFVLIMGVVEFGRAYNIRQNVTNAAREGARFAVAPDPATGALPTATEVQAQATAFLSSINATGTVTVTAATHVINNIDVVYTQVTVTVPYSFFFFPFGTVSIASTSEMRNETN